MGEVGAPMKPKGEFERPLAGSCCYHVCSRYRCRSGPGTRVVEFPDGVLSHNDLSASGLFRTDHGGEMRFTDFIALGIFPTVDSPTRWTDDNFLR